MLEDKLKLKRTKAYSLQNSSGFFNSSGSFNRLTHHGPNKMINQQSDLLFPKNDVIGDYAYGSSANEFMKKRFTRKNYPNIAVQSTKDSKNLYD